MSDDTAGKPQAPSAYELRRWDWLEAYWQRQDKRHGRLPTSLHGRMEEARERAREFEGHAEHAVEEVLPEPVKHFVDASLGAMVESAIHLLNLVADWSAELTNPDTVLNHHRRLGREVNSLSDLGNLDLEELDEVTNRLALTSRTFGAFEGGALGLLAMVPVAGGAAAITFDLVVMQILTSAIATQVCYAYGFDATDPEHREVVSHIAGRSFAEQASKADVQRSANLAKKAVEGRRNWSNALRENHRLLEATERVMKLWKGGAHVSVAEVADFLPVISVVVGSGTNAYMLGHVAHSATHYAQTLYLAQKYYWPLPSRFQQLAVMPELGDNPPAD